MFLNLTMFKNYILGHRLEMLCSDVLVQEAIEAHKNGEMKEEPIEVYITN